MATHQKQHFLCLDARRRISRRAPDFLGRDPVKSGHYYILHVYVPLLQLAGRDVTQRKQNHSVVRSPSLPGVNGGSHNKRLIYSSNSETAPNTGVFKGATGQTSTCEGRDDGAAGGSKEISSLCIKKCCDGQTGVLFTLTCSHCSWFMSQGSTVL